MELASVDASSTSVTSPTLVSWSSSELDSSSTSSSVYTSLESDATVSTESELRETEPSESVDGENEQPHVQKQLSDAASAKIEESTGPLYEGADVSIVEAYLLIFTFGMTFHLSGRAFNMLLLVITTLPKKNAKIPQSIHSLKQFFTCFLILYQVCILFVRIVVNLCHHPISDALAVDASYDLDLPLYLWHHS